MNIKGGYILFAPDAFLKNPKFLAAYSVKRQIKNFAGGLCKFFLPKEPAPVCFESFPNFPGKDVGFADPAYPAFIKI